MSATRRHAMPIQGQGHGHPKFAKMANFLYYL